MKKLLKSRTSQAGLGIVILLSVVAISGCGVGQMKSEMKEQPMGSKGAAAPGVDPNKMRGGYGQQGGAGAAPGAPGAAPGAPAR